MRKYDLLVDQRVHKKIEELQAIFLDHDCGFINSEIILESALDMLLVKLGGAEHGRKLENPRAKKTKA